MKELYIDKFQNHNVLIKNIKLQNKHKTMPLYTVPLKAHSNTVNCL